MSSIRSSLVPGLAACLLIVGLASLVGVAAGSTVVDGWGSDSDTHIPNDLDGESAYDFAPLQSNGDSPQYVGADRINATRQQHPAEADDSGDDARIAEWAGERLAESLAESTTALSNGEYDRARQSLEDEYDERVRQHAAVVEDDDSATGYDTVAESQRDLIDAIESYDDVEDEYRAARQAGDDDRALEIAVELDTIDAEIDNQSSRTLQRYDSLDAASDQEFDAQIATIENVRTSQQDTHESIRTAEFASVELQVDVDSPTASFGSPLEITGTVVAEDAGAPLDGNVMIREDERVVETPIDDDGTVQLTYRPALLLADTDEVTVEFVPSTGSPYLTDETAVPIEPDPAEPNMELTEVDESVSFGTNVTATAAIDVEDAPVDVVPVTASIDGHPVGDDVRTDGDGTVRIDASLPADVPAGERELLVSYQLTDRSITSASANQTVTVEETETVLQFEAEPTRAGGMEPDDEVLEVTGTLDAVDGTSVTDQRITLYVGDTAVREVRTDEDGEFERTLERGDFDGADDARLYAVFDGAGNLEGAQASTPVTISGAGIGGTGVGLPWIRWLLLGFAVLLVGGLLAAVRSDSPIGSTPIVAALTGPPTVEHGRDYLLDGVGGSSIVLDSPPSLDDASLTAARGLLADDEYDEATVAAFEVVRRDLNADLTPSDRIREEQPEGVDTDNADRYRRLVTAYERAALTPIPVTESTAEGAIEDAAKLADRKSTDGR